jgi:hypothetical protein
MCKLYFGLITAFTLDAGQLAVSQYPEGPATGHLDTGFSCKIFLGPRAKAEMVPAIPSCLYMLLMWPSRLKFSSYQMSLVITCKMTTATG